jgi:prepilin-type N-terminal cleavage/methylation domain-containing protein
MRPVNDVEQAMNTPRTTRSAFTLIEILCVVVIIGIAAALVVPEIGSRDDLKAAAASRILMADLVYAQNRAITLQKTQYLKFETDPGRYGLYTSPGMAMVTHPVNLTNYEMLFGSTPGLKDATLVSADFVGQAGATQHTLAFDDLGTPLACNAADGTTDTLRSASIVVQAGAYRLAVRVEPYTGALKVENVP